MALQWIQPHIFQLNYVHSSRNILCTMYRLTWIHHKAIPFPFAPGSHAISEALYGDECPISNACDCNSVLYAGCWLHYLTHLPLVKKSPPFHKRHFNCIFMNENLYILIRISQKCVPKGQIDCRSVLVQVMACHRIGDKPLAGPMLTQYTDAYMQQKGRWLNEFLCKPYIFFAQLTLPFLYHISIASVHICPAFHLRICTIDNPQCKIFFQQVHSDKRQWPWLTITQLQMNSTKNIPRITCAILLKSVMTWSTWS